MRGARRLTMVEVVGQDRKIFPVFAWLTLVALFPIGVLSLVVAVLSGIFLVAMGFLLAMMLGLSAILLAVLKLPPLKINLPRAKVVPDHVVEVFKRDGDRE